MNATDKYKTYLERQKEHNKKTYKRKKERITKEEKLWIWEQLHSIPMTGEAHGKAVLNNLREQYKRLNKQKQSDKMSA